MAAATLFQQVRTDLILHSEQYRVCIEAAAVVVLCYIGITDLRTFKIRNSGILLLLALYILYALVARSWAEILSNVILAVIVFGALLGLYAKGVLGGGDVKLLPVVCLWIGAHCALLFSALLLALIGLHLGAAKIGWANTSTLTTSTMKQRRAIPYAPSVAGALIGIILLGCL
jgi:prepilin peptidase CpaA